MSMSKAEIEKTAQKAYKIGQEYEKVYRGCGQCTVAAIADALGVTTDEIFKATTAFGGGIGLLGDGSCGTYVGGVLMFGHFIGRVRSDFVDAPKVRHTTYRLARQLHELFIKEYGSITCRDIQTKIFGRPYYLASPQEFEAFEADGGHDDKCPNVVGNACGWVVELLGEEKLI